MMIAIETFILFFLLLLGGEFWFSWLFHNKMFGVVPGISGKQVHNVGMRIVGCNLGSLVLETGVFLFFIEI